MIPEALTQPIEILFAPYDLLFMGIACFALGILLGLVIRR